MPFNRSRLIRQVDLFSLKLFLSAIDEGQIGRAAIRENISASTATKRIQDLEEIAGIKLFERAPAGVMPSPAGLVVEKYFRAIFKELEDLRAEISAFSEGIRGEVTVASARSIIMPFLAQELGEFERQFPAVDVILQEIENAQIVSAIVNGEADIGVFAFATGLDLSAVDAVNYREDRLVAVVPASHPLASRQKLTLADLLTETIIPINAILGALQSATRRAGQSFEPKFAVKSTGVALSLVEAGLGVTIVPECTMGREQESLVSAVMLAEPWAKRITAIATAKGRPLSPVALALKNQLLSHTLPPRKEKAASRD